MSPQNNEAAHLLDAIRQSEAEVTRKLAAARETATLEIAAAQDRAIDLIAEAEEQGRREGEQRRQDLLDQVEQEVQQIVSQAQAEADALRGVTATGMAEAVRQALNIITGEDAVSHLSPVQEKHI